MFSQENLGKPKMRKGKVARKGKEKFGERKRKTRGKEEENMRKGRGKERKRKKSVQVSFSLYCTIVEYTLSALPEALSPSILIYDSSIDFVYSLFINLRINSVF